MRFHVYTLIFIAGMTGCAVAQQSLDQTTINDIKWSMWHQGAIVWDNNGNGNGFVDAGTAYSRILQVQNGAGKTRIIQAGPENVHAALPVAVAQCKAEHADFPGDMHWVCFHEGMVDPILTAARAGNFTAVRQDYWQKEKHDDNKASTAACWNAQDLISVLVQQCGYKP